MWPDPDELLAFGSKHRITSTLRTCASVLGNDDPLSVLIPRHQLGITAASIIQGARKGALKRDFSTGRDHVITGKTTSESLEKDLARDAQDHAIWTQATQFLTPAWFLEPSMLVEKVIKVIRLFVVNGAILHWMDATPLAASPSNDVQPDRAPRRRRRGGCVCNPKGFRLLTSNLDCLRAILRKGNPLVDELLRKALMMSALWIIP